MTKAVHNYYVNSMNQKYEQIIKIVHTKCHTPNKAKRGMFDVEKLS